MMRRRAIGTLTVLCILLFPAFSIAQANDGHGKEWRQLDETTNLSWDNVASVCPRDGASPCVGTVGARDLTGWVWATKTQVIELFSYYHTDILTSESVSGPQYFVPAVGFLSAFRPTFWFAGDYAFAYFVGGWTASTDEATNLPFAGAVGYGNTPAVYGDFGVASQSSPTEMSSVRGVFLWRATGLGGTVIAYDEAGEVPSPAGGTAVASVLANDWLGGELATTLSVALTQLSSTHAGVTLDPSDGSVDVAGGTPAGVHTLVYNICELANPSNCDDATVTVTVNPYVVSAANDQGSASPSTGGAAVANVLANDSLGDARATTANVTLSQLSSTSAGVTLDLSDGSVDVAVGTASGVHTLVYRICETASPSNCAQATATVTVAPFVVDAVDDQARASSKNASTAIASVLANDRIGGARATTANVRLSQVSPRIAGITLNLATGSVDVAAKTPSGIYSLVYQICETASPSNCDQATATIELSGRDR